VANDNLQEPIQIGLKKFRLDVTNASGDNHLYKPFDSILDDISTARKKEIPLDDKTAVEILETIKLLVEENAKGRRPWTGNWELYFEQCMDNAVRLLREYCSFQDHEKYIPKSYCRQFQDSLYAMDRFAQVYADYKDKHLQLHFLHLAVMAAEMFSMTADETAGIDEKALETQDDGMFTYLLTGVAKTGKAKELLLRYCEDEEAWVRDLALQILHQYYK
jgi:hypothetical protein